MKLRRVIAALLIVSISGLALPMPAYAGMLPTDTAISSPDRERIAAFLDRDAVRSQLVAYGVSPADVKSRLGALSDAEVAKIAGEMDSLPAGADAAGAIIGAALLIFIILLITDLLGLTHVFPFVKPMR
jgi:hypothetical protein